MKLARPFVIIISIVLFNYDAFAATYYARQTGNWSNPATWSLSCGGPPETSIPGSMDDVVITCNLNAYTVTVDGNFSCNNLTIGQADRNAILQITNVANSLTINGDLSINTGNFNRTYRLDAGPGQITINNIVFWSTTNGVNEIALTTGTINFNSSINLTSTSQSVNFNGTGTVNFNQDFTGRLNQILTVANCNINFYRNITNNITAATFNATSNSRFYGTNNSISANTDITFGRTFFMPNSNITINNTAGNVIFGHDITINNSSSLILNKGIIVNRSWINNGGTLSGGTHFVRFLGIPSNTYNIGGLASTNFPNLFFGNTNGTTRFRYNLNANATALSLTLENNSLNATSFLRHQTGNPTLTINGDVTIKQLNADNTNSWLINAGSAVVNGNLIFSGTNNTASRIVRVAVTTGSFTLNGNILWMNNSEVATEDISATSGSLIFNNSVLLNRGSGRIRVTGAGGTVRFNGTTMPSLQVNAGSGINAEFFTAASTNIYFNRGLENNNSTLTFGNNSNTYITGNANVTPNALIRFSNLNINSGATLNLLGNIDVTNNWINNGGAFNANNSTVVFNGTAPQIIQETNSFFILTASTAGNTINCNTNLTISNTLNITGHNFNMNGNTLTLGNNAASTLNHSNNTIVYNGTFRRWWPASAVISPSASPFYGLFPVGINGNYRPVRITSTTAPSTAGYISVRHNDPQNVFDLVPNFNDAGNLIQRVSGQNATIQLSGISGGSYNIQVQYGGFNNPGGSNISHYRMITYTSGIPGAVGTHVATSGTVAAPLGSRNALTATQLNNVFVIGTTNANATPILRIFYARKNGNWSDGTGNATWSTIAPGGVSCNCTPPANSVVEISNGYVVNLDVNATVNDIGVNNAQLIGTGNLTVNNNFIVSGSGSFNPTTGNYTIGNNLIINGSGTSNFSSGNNQILGNLENYATLNFGSSTLPLIVRGNWLNNGVFNPNNGTVLLNGNISQSIFGNTNFNNLNINNLNGVSITSLSSVQIINTLTIQTGTFNTSGNLTLLSTPSRTARLASLSGSSDIIGDIIMQRYVHDSGVSGPLGKWREICAPVIGATFADWQDDFTTWGLVGSNGFSINNFISIYQYDESVPDVNDSGYVSPTNINEQIDHPNGYWAYIDNTPLTIDVKGSPGKGNVDLGVTYTLSSAGVDHDGWNLVANPYPSPINWDATAWTKVNIEDAIYVWNPTLQQYASYAGGVGVNGGTAHVASSQSFWVHAIGANPSLIATENVKSSVDGTFKSNNISPPRGLLLKINGNGFSDETAIRFTNSATDSFDLAFDASKLWSFNANVPSISSVALNHDYSINTLPEFTENISIPVRVWTYVSTNFTITANLSDFPYQNACITLEDLQTGIVQDLRIDSTYSCFISDTTDLPRFVLHISLPIEKNIQHPTCNNQNDGKIIAKGSGAGPWTYTWKDLNGQVIRTINNIQTSDTLSNLAPGFYIVEVQNTLCGNFSDTIQIINPSPITVNYSITQPTCKNSEDGLIELLPAGGTEPYNFNWSDGTSSQSLYNAQAAMYQVQIVDANLCSSAFSFVLNALYPVSSEFACSADTVYLQNNAANVQFTNLSVGAVSFEWDFDDGEDVITTANPNYTFISEGIYIVKLKAINQSCDDIYEKTIVVLNEIPATVQSNSHPSLSINAFASGDKIMIVFKGEKNEDVKVALFDNLGRETIAYSTIPKNNLAFEIPYTGIAKGIYYLRLTGDNLGEYTIKILIP